MVRMARRTRTPGPATGVCPIVTNVLVIDEAAVLEPVSVALEREGFAVLVATTYGAALAQARAFHPEVALVAARLADGCGFDVLRELRRRDPGVRVLVTGHGTGDEHAQALLLGADDYLVKPLAPRQVAARVMALVRPQPVTPVIDLAELEIDTSEMSPPEFDLLAHLASHPRQTFTVEQLGGGGVVELVHALRQSIEPDPDRPRWVVTIRDVGYRFEPGFVDQRRGVRAFG